MERKYLWWHSGRAFLVGATSLAVGSLAATAMLILSRASILGTIGACLAAVALLPFSFALDRRIRRSKAQVKQRARGPAPLCRDSRTYAPPGPAIPGRA